MKRKNVLVFSLLASMMLTMVGCGNSTPEAAPAVQDVEVVASADASASGDASADASYANQTEDGFTMDLSQITDKWTYNADLDCYALENLVYCEQPKSTALQSMNIYVPAAYMKEDGSIDASASVNGYTAETAPIIYKNGVAGYMEAAPSAITMSEKEYIDAGFVYVSVGSRGRGTQDENGVYIGKSPEGLVDLKAGIRFLKANNAVIAGSTDRIVSVGTSAGGAMSSLLGITGNSANYDEYLAAIGAVMTETDDIYAAQCYCPITDLENADKAYEWQFNADHSYLGFLSPGGDLSDFQIAVSDELKAAYVDYYNSLELVDFDGNPLSLNADGSGSGYDFFVSQLEAAAAKHLTKMANGELDVDYTVEDYIAGNYTYSEMDFATSQDIIYEGHKYDTFLSWDGENASISDIDTYVLNYNRRLKACPAFDNLDAAEAENQEMGNETTDVVHFNEDLAPILEKLKDSYPEEVAQYYDAYAAVAGNKEVEQKKYLLNPMNYLGSDEVSDKASFFRIRVGSYDPHTSGMVSLNLALKIAETTDAEVDYAQVWDQAHGEADYAGEFTAWVEGITK